MSAEARDRLEFQRYLEYQQAQRQHRVETLGGAATVLFLSTIDLGLTEARDPSRELRRPAKAESDAAAEVLPVRMGHQRNLAHLAIESAELGYARAA